MTPFSKFIKVSFNSIVHDGLFMDILSYLDMDSALKLSKAMPIITQSNMVNTVYQTYIRSLLKKGISTLNRMYYWDISTDGPKGYYT